VPRVGPTPSGVARPPLARLRSAAGTASSGVSSCSSVAWSISKGPLKEPRARATASSRLLRTSRKVDHPCRCRLPRGSARLMAASCHPPARALRENVIEPQLRQVNIA
jgi:hypothetical protein